MALNDLVTVQGLLIWRICLTVIHGLAMSSGVFRLYRQKKIGKLWWDDLFAAVALLFEMAYFPTLWAQAIPVSNSTVEINQQFILSQIVSTWLVQVAFFLQLWFSRISLALSIARFVPPRSLWFKACIGLACIFFLMCMSLELYMDVQCARDLSWTKIPPFQCTVFPTLIIEMLGFDFFSDISLVAIPAWAFWTSLRLTPATRRLIKACFAASFITAAWNVVFLAVLISTTGKFVKIQNYHPAGLTNGVLLAIFQPHLLGPISNFVCNLLIVITSVYRWFREDARRLADIPRRHAIDTKGQATTSEATVTASDDLYSEVPRAAGLSRQDTPATIRLQLTEIRESTSTMPTPIPWTSNA